MEKENEKLRAVVIQGWVGMLFLLIMMILTDLIEFGMRGDFSPLIKDPGIGGLWFIAVVTSVSVIVQMLLRTQDARSCRWAFFVVTVAYTLAFIAHQAIHIISGEGFDIHFLLDVTHHSLGVWASIAAYRWAILGGSYKAKTC